VKRLRSILYTPGHRRDRIAKAASAGADGIGLVLEDSVPHDRRPEARAAVAEAIGTLAADGLTVVVKVNPPGPDGLAEDLEQVAVAGLAGLIVPKLSSAEEVRAVDRMVAAAEEARGLAPGTIELILMIETPRAVVSAFEMAAAAPRVASVVCAAAANGDLAGALGLEATPTGVERHYVLSKVLVDARAAGIETPIDGVWAGVGDLDGLEREARLARSLGYRAKLAIHPEQIATINRVFTPSAREVEQASRVVDAFEDALLRGEAAIVVDGRMVDYAMVETARRVLQLAADLGHQGS
jgi:citrate lyase subunit beta / citryl-CoA lyase